MKRNDELKFPAPALRGINSNTADLPVAVKEIISGEEHDAYCNELVTSGAISQPRVVASIAAYGARLLLEPLVLHAPEVGAAVVYGGIRLGTDLQLFHAYSAARDVLVECYHSQPSSLSLHAISLLVGAIRSAEERRGGVCDGVPARSGCEHYVGLVSAAKQLPDLAACPASDIFNRITGDIDILAAAMKSGTVPNDTFFSDPTPSVENYLRAVYAASSETGSALERAGLEYLARLDGPLTKHLGHPSGPRSVQL